MVCDDACLGVPDLRRREQGLMTVDALESVDHISSSQHPAMLALDGGMAWMAGIAIVPLVRSLPVSVT
jgi:hypothetical protein